MEYTRLATFKAKYGISYEKAASLFEVDIQSIRDYIKTDSMPDDLKDRLKLYEFLAEHIIRESRDLKEMQPYIQVLEHDKEVLFNQINDLRMKVEALKKPMTFIERIIFLFTGKRSVKNYAV